MSLSNYFPVELKLMHHQLSNNTNWLDDASKAIIDVFQLIPPEGNDFNKSQSVNSTPEKSYPGQNRKEDKPNAAAAAVRKPKYPAVWMLPYLVKNLKFLQNGVLKVSGDYLDRGNWSRGVPTSSGQWHFQM